MSFSASLICLIFNNFLSGKRLVIEGEMDQNGMVGVKCLMYGRFDCWVREVFKVALRSLLDGSEHYVGIWHCSRMPTNERYCDVEVLTLSDKFHLDQSNRAQNTTPVSHSSKFHSVSFLLHANFRQAFKQRANLTQVHQMTTKLMSFSTKGKSTPHMYLIYCSVTASV